MNLVHFHVNSRKSEILGWDEKLFRWKITEELQLMKSKNDAKFEEKVEIWFKKRHEEFGEF